MDTSVIKVATETLTAGGLKILAAILLWFVGSKLVAFALAIASKAMSTQRLDTTLASYLRSTLSVVLNIFLVVALLSYFGIETTSFAALFAAAGVAIGAAWSGLLANFAAGVFLVIFRPFRVGEFISVAGVTGVVREIGLFVTTIDTPENVQTIIGNNKIFADNIQNYTANSYRRVDLVAQTHHSVSYAEASRVIQERLVNVRNVLSTPAPDVEVLQFNLAGIVLAVRPYCKPEHYWQVYFDTNRIISESFSDAGFPIPEQHYAIRQESAKTSNILASNSDSFEDSL